MGWSLADQALTSLTSFALGLIVARSVGPSDFGAFSVAFATYLAALNASRAVATQPLLIRFVAVPAAVWRRGTQMATGTVMALGLIAGLGCLAVGAIARGPLGEALVALGITLPGLLVRDTWRFAFFAAGRGRDAFANDLALLLVLVPALGILALSGHTSVFLATLAWGGAGVAASVIGALQAHVRPLPRMATTWWREQRDIAGRYAGEVATDALAGQISLYAIAAIAGLATVGALRASDLLLGPLNVLLQGLYLVAIAEGVRFLRVSARRLRDACLLLSAGLAGATIVWGSAMLALPEGVGTSLLGASWGPGRAVLFPGMLALAGLSTIIGAWVGLRSLAAARRSFRARVVSSTTTLSCAVAGAMLGGTSGAAWGFVVGNWIGVVIWWWQFVAALREHQMAVAPAAGAATPSRD